MKLKRKALLALGALTAEATKNPKVREALLGLAQSGVKKAGKLMQKASDWLEKFDTELRKDKPTVYVFVQAEKWDRPMFRFIKTIDEKLGDAGQVVAVWLTDDADKSKTYLPKISTYFTNAALTVFFTVGGTADNGLDYAAIPPFLVLAPGHWWPLVLAPLYQLAPAGTIRIADVPAIRAMPG